MEVAALCLAIAFAYRGKGGLFEAWGIPFDTLRHCIGALIVASALVFVLHISLYWLPVFAVLWVYFTKPDTGTGFAAVDGDAVNLQVDLHQTRPWVEFPLYGIDAIARGVFSTTGNAMLAGVAWMTLRQTIFIMPISLLTYYFGKGNIYALAGTMLLGSLYWLGGIFNRKWNIDPVAFAETATGLVGLVFYGLLM